MSIKPTPNEESINAKWMEMVDRLMVRIQDLENENSQLRMSAGLKPENDIPLTAYLAERTIPYEGSSLLGIYSTSGIAQLACYKFVAEFNFLSLTDIPDFEWRENKGVEFAEYEGFQFSITAFKVDEYVNK